MRDPFKLPFSEAEAFFKAKLNMPAERWDSLWQEQHAKGFMVAGATKADLVADFRAAIDQAVAGGMSKREFLGKFDEIVARHGWSYNGGRKWRSDLIWQVNTRTAYQAGRWQQFTESGVKFLEYRHADGVINPRPLHVSWDGLILPITDPWWQTHYPPNGWACHCRALAATLDDYARAAKNNAPADGIDPKTGAPAGIDKGWAYNVGQAAGQDYRGLADKFEALPNAIAREWMGETVKQPAFQRFLDGQLEGDFPVAVLRPEDQGLLGTNRQTVWFSADSRDKNLGLTDRSSGHPELSLEEYRLLPEVVGDPQVVIDRQGSRAVFARVEGRMYLAVVKTTAQKDELFLLTYRRSSPTDLERERRLGQVVLDRLQKGNGAGL